MYRLKGNKGKKKLIKLSTQGARRKKKPKQSRKK